MLNVFKRVTTSGKYIAEIDGLRFLAISLVILFHANIWSEDLYGLEKNIFWKIIDMGNIGVQFFFVISGFIIYLLVEKPFMLSKRKSILNYYRNIFRINYK